MQNRLDGIKTMDMIVNALGCSILQNVGSGVRVCHVDKGAACKLFVRSRDAIDDLKDMVKCGYDNKMHKATILVDKDLTALLQSFRDAQIKESFNELTQASTLEMRKYSDSLVIDTGGNSIRVNKEGSGSNRFMAWFKCCMSPK